MKTKTLGELFPKERADRAAMEQAALIAHAWKTNARARAAFGIHDDHRFAEYVGRPVAFCEEILGFHPWGPEESPTGHRGQQGILEDLWEFGAVSVDSCNNAGKTMCAAAAVLAFNQTIPNSIIITTAPTWHQVESLLWRRIRSAWNKARVRLEGKILQTRIECGDMWYAEGLSTNEEERFQGPHAEIGDIWKSDFATRHEGAVLVVLDEKSGVKPLIYDAIAGFLAQLNVFLLWIGNPTRAEGPPYQVAKTGRWIREFKHHHIAARDVPPEIMNQQWLLDMEHDFGEDHPQYIIRVLGEYVEGSTQQIFPSYMIEACDKLRFPGEDGIHMGFDVARHGGDACVATLTDRGQVVAVEAWTGDDLTEHAEKLATIGKEWKCPDTNWHIDIGMGAGVADRLREAGLEPDLVDWGASADWDWPELVGQDMKFRNRKAEMCWVARQNLVHKLTTIPERFAQTRRQLGWINGGFDDQDVFGIEKKDKLKAAHLGQSPDFADSFILSFSRVPGGFQVYRG